MFLDPDKVILKNIADAIGPNCFEIPCLKQKFYESICTQIVYVLKLLIIFILIKFLVLIQYVQNSNFAFALPLKV